MLSARRLAVVAAFFVAVPLAAQRSDPRLSPQEPNAATVAAPAPDSATVSLAPAAERAVAGVRAPNAQPAPTPSPLLMPRRGPSSQNTALMIVGGAAFLAGAIIGGAGGTFIMIGGLGVGIYGLYQYLQ
jgi:hypothetical protein